MELHPVLVHFPLVLLPLSAILDLVARRLGKQDWHLLTYGILILGTLGAAGAVLSGNDAAGEHRADPVVSHLIQQHEDWATASLFLFLVVALGRLPFQLRRRDPLPWTLVALVGSVLLWIAAHHGGELVYEHGVGVELSRGIE